MPAISQKLEKKVRTNIGPHDQAGFHPEGHLPGGEHRHVHPSASMNTLELAVVKSNRITVAFQSYAVFLLAYYM